MRECHTCNHRVMGLGCLLTNKRVTDHQHCDKWESIVNRSIHDQAAIDQYHQAGMRLELGEIA